MTMTEVEQTTAPTQNKPTPTQRLETAQVSRWNQAAFESINNTAYITSTDY